MSGLAGWVGDAPRAILDLMLGAIDYRGDRSDRWFGPGVALGYRWWGGRPGKSPGVVQRGARTIVCAGTLTPPVASPADALLERFSPATPVTGDLDGAFAFALWNEADGSLVLGRDPFGVRSLYYVEHGGTLFFATELKQLLAVADLPVVVNTPALHKYLTFSFVPGEDVPVRGVRRLLPGHLLRWQKGKLTTKAYFRLQEDLDPALADRHEAVRVVRRLGRQAVARRLTGEPEVGLFLSGGLDSSSVAVWLQRAGAKVRAYSLDFGDHSVERDQAAQVAEALSMPLRLVPVDGAAVRDAFWQVVHRLDLPFGDAVTAPLYLLGQAARADGLAAVFNGEGGDQLFGGWTSKPMIAAELYAGLTGGEDESREAAYLHSYHKFYGLEADLYTPEFQAQVGGPGQRRALLQPYLHERDGTFLHQVRLADISLKGSQNILPRAERLTNGWGLDVRVPFFDRVLAETSFRLPPELKLHGACEKYVLKLALSKALPHDIVWRKKFGMSVPITDFALGPLRELLDDLLGEASLRSRGFFQPAYVARLLAGGDTPGETRRRRVGEKLWALAMLEAWLRVFVDRRGVAR